MSAPSRRALLGAPVLLSPIPQSAPAIAGAASVAAAATAPAPAAAGDVPPLPAVPGACFDLGRDAERAIRQYQMLARQDGAASGEGREGRWHRLQELSDEIDALQRRILRTRAVTALDVLAKLLVANVAIERAMHNQEDLESCEQAQDAVRDCIIAIADLTGASLIELGADWDDSLLCVLLQPELRRVLPAIYSA